MTTVAEKYLQIAKLAKDPANAEVVIDGILTFFGLDYFDLDLGVEYLYTTKVIDYKFRSVLHKTWTLSWHGSKKKQALPMRKLLLPKLKKKNMLQAA